MSRPPRQASWFDSGRTLADRFRTHAGTSTHLYGYAMRAMADDWEAGGVVRSVCAGYEQAPEGSVLQLRLLAGVFRIVLTGRAPGLVRFYPCLGGTDSPEHAWPHLREVFADHAEELHQALVVAPQTNEVGRCAALLAGLFDLVAAAGVSRIALLEVGASAGLNLLLDSYGLSGDGWRWGSATSPVQLESAIIGRLRPAPVTIVSRRGCDLHPVDVTTEAGRLLLTSFVWPFDLHRHRRLAAALKVARDRPPVVDQASAADWLADRLPRTEGSADVLPVVWQSITELYWPPEETRRVQRLLAHVGCEQRLGHVAMEYAPGASTTASPQVSTALWSPDRSSVRRRVLGTAHDHGVPVRLLTAGTPEADALPAQSDRGRGDQIGDGVVDLGQPVPGEPGHVE